MQACRQRVLFPIFWLMAVPALAACGSVSDAGPDSDPQPDPPVAAIAAPASALELQRIHVDGGSSRAGSGAITRYTWSQLSGPPVDLQDADGAMVSFTAPIVDGAAAVELALTITTDTGAQAMAQASVAIERNAFVFYVSGDTDAGHELWRVGRDDGDPVRLSPAAEAGVRIRSFRVSPDRRHVAIERARAATGNEADVWLAATGGTELDNISAELAPTSGSLDSWSPDSRYLAFQARTSADATVEELFTVDATTGVIAQISRISTTDDFDNAAVEAGDSANARGPDGIPDSARTNADQQPRGRVLRVVWSPTSKLAFVAEAHSYYAELFTAAADGSDYRQHIDLLRDADGAPGFDYDSNGDGRPDALVATSILPRWSPAGDVLAFSLRSFVPVGIGGLVYTTTLTSTEPTLRLVGAPTLMPAPRRARQFEFSPDGAYLLVVADRDHTDVVELYSVQLATGAVRTIGPANMDFFPADGNPDSDADGDLVPDGDVTRISSWVDDRRLVYHGDLRRDGVVEAFVASVDRQPTAAQNVVSLTDVFAIDWNHDGVADIPWDNPWSNPASGWRYPHVGGITADGELLISAALTDSEVDTTYIIATDGTGLRELYTPAPERWIDDAIMLGREHALIVEYAEIPTSGDYFYEARIVPTAGGESMLIIDLMRDYDTDGDGWPNYSVEHTSCADEACTAVLAVVRPIDPADGVGFVAETDIATGAMRRIADIPATGQYRLVVSER